MTEMDHPAPQRRPLLPAAALLVVAGLVVAAFFLGRATSGTDTSAAATTNVADLVGNVNRGRGLYLRYTCEACHSVDGQPGTGPTLKGVVGAEVELADGTRVTADRAYLTRAIVDPDVQIVKGYYAGSYMAKLTSAFGLERKPQDVADLVAYIESSK
jgi:cytochrome c oxidase subunit 2